MALKKVTDKSLYLFPVFCHECGNFTPTDCNYGWCKMKKIGNLDRSVYENSTFCEMDRRKFNHNILTKRLNGEISHLEMYKLYRR